MGQFVRPLTHPRAAIHVLAAAIQIRGSLPGACADARERVRQSDLQRRRGLPVRHALAAARRGARGRRTGVAGALRQAQSARKVSGGAAPGVGDLHGAARLYVAIGLPRSGAGAHMELPDGALQG
ncbi:hypothetical protein SDC9_200810 [bioreactor metagenome]|uniref:Uncharacterized protein n=1 Tax=bioreactor metagenome TaxID=1076179 RepID=A0A645IPY9_9ZZZZ